VNDWPRQTWIEAEPKRADRERAAMASLAPDMEWSEVSPAGGWEGYAPLWPIARAKPRKLKGLVEGRRLRLCVLYSQGFPMAQPVLFPLDPEPPVERRTVHDWHLNGDGSLCLLRTVDLWNGRETAADLVVKASGWFIEYMLMERGLIEAMTENGIHSNKSLDALIRGLDL